MSPSPRRRAALLPPAPGPRRPRPLAAGWLAALALPLGLGCGASWPEVDNARWMNSVGAPHIRRVRDLGTRPPPQSGPLAGESDGVASPGEYLLIEGAGFGKSPAVTVDGRAAEVVARTAGAGIVARVPAAVGAGARPVVVTVGESASGAPFALRRLALVLHGGALQASAVDGESVTPVGVPIAARGASSLAISPDGACAYALSGAQLLVIDLGAAGGPRLLTTRDLKVPATQLLGATRAARLVAAGPAAAQIFDIADPRAPAAYQPTTLPAEALGAIRADLDGDGNRLALIVPEGNRAVVVDIARPTRALLVGDVALLPEARVPLLRDVRFAPEGDLVRVLSGDGAGSLAVGAQPTRLSLLKIERPEGAPAGEAQASAWMTAQLSGAWPPLRLEAVRVPPVQSGATIRLPPQKTAVRFTSVPAALLSAAAGRPSLEALQGGLEQGDGTGEAARVVETRLLLGASAGSPDDRSVVALAVRGEGGGPQFGLAVVTLSHPPSFRFTALSPALASDTAAPFALGELVLQP